MKVSINLASEPFRPMRPILVAGAAAAVLLLGTLGLLLAISMAQSGQAAELSRTLDKLERQSRTLDAQEAKLQEVLRRPENAEVLDRSLFLNTLLYAKGISWTRMFDDLEKVMPYNVRLISIRPQVTGEGHVSLDMVVGAESPEPVIQMLARLEQSGQFGGVQPHTRTPPSQGEPLLRYRISVNYTQKL